MAVTKRTQRRMRRKHNSSIKRGGWYNFLNKKKLPDNVRVLKDYFQELIQYKKTNNLKDLKEVKDPNAPTDPTDHKNLPPRYFQNPANSDLQTGKFHHFSIYYVYNIEIVKPKGFLSPIEYMLDAKEITNDGKGQDRIFIISSKFKDTMNAEIKVYEKQPKDISDEHTPWDAPRVVGKNNDEKIAAAIMNINDAVAPTPAADKNTGGRTKRRRNMRKGKRRISYKKKSR